MQLKAQLNENKVQSMDAYDAMEAKAPQVILKQPGMEQYVLIS